MNAVEALSRFNAQWQSPEARAWRARKAEDMYANNPEYARHMDELCALFSEKKSSDKSKVEAVTPHG